MNENLDNAIARAEQWKIAALNQRAFMLKLQHATVWQRFKWLLHGYKNDKRFVVALERCTELCKAEGYITDIPCEQDKNMH